MKFKKTFKTVVAVFALLATVTGTGAQELPVRIGLSSNSFATAPALLADIMGLYGKHGLKPELTVAESSSIAGTGLIAGSFDVAMVGSGQLIASQGRGQDVVAIGSIYGGSSGTLILSKAAVERLAIGLTETPEKRLKALDGLSIATPSATSSFTFAFVEAARQAGAEPVMTYMSQGAMASALQAGVIDGFIASAPFWAGSIENGSGVAWLYGTRGELGASHTLSSASIIQIMRANVDANAEIIRRLRLVYADFATAVKQEPAEVKKALLQLYPTLTQKTVDFLFDAEAVAWTYPPLTAENMVHDIALVKATGVPLPNIDSVDPNKLLVP